MGIPTLIKTQTASGSDYLDFIDGTSDVVFDSTYDEYMFVFTDIGPATDQTQFSFQVMLLMMLVEVSIQALLLQHFLEQFTQKMIVQQNWDM